jgi:hypothetical protein
VEPERSYRLNGNEIGSSRRSGFDEEVPMGWLAEAMVFLVPAVGSIAMFSFLAVVGWAAQRRRERESYYRYEFRKRLVETGQMNSNDLRELHRYEVETEFQRRRQGLLAGGMITAGSGIGLIFGLRFIEDEAVWMVGYIPLFIGLGMLAYGLVMARGKGPGTPPPGAMPEA